MAAILKDCLRLIGGKGLVGGQDVAAGWRISY